MHVIRLVEGGVVDKVIAFDSLPKRLITGLKTKGMDGFPRYWKRWLEDNESIRPCCVLNPNTGIAEDSTEPCTFILDYKAVNEDKERWQMITNYVRKAVDLSVRLKDKIEDMAEPFSKDASSELYLEPEKVPVIPIPSEMKEAVKEPEPQPQLQPAKKRGRPKKVSVEV